MPRVEVSIGKEVLVSLCGRQERRCFQHLGVTAGITCPSCHPLANYIIAKFLFFSPDSSLRFAYMVATVLLSVLVRKLYLHPVKGQVMEAKYELVTSPKEEAWITVSKRS